MKRFLLVVVLLLVPVSVRAETPKFIARLFMVSPDSPHKLFSVSQVVVGALRVADTAVTEHCLGRASQSLADTVAGATVPRFHCVEGNPALGRFYDRPVLFGVVQGGIQAAQQVLLKKLAETGPKGMKVAISINFSSAALIGYVVYRNSQVAAQ